jgi:glutathione S-transferase
MKLYQIHASQNCYRVRLMLALLGKTAEIVEIDHAGGELHSAGYKAINPLSEVPVLVDGALTLRDSQAIIVYLARAYGAPTWCPTAPADQARLQQWLSFAANEIQNGPRLARGIVLWGRSGNLDEAQARTRRALEFLDGHLGGRVWLETDHPTVADVACYPYVNRAGDARIDMSAYPDLNAWLRRFEALEGFIGIDARLE